MWRCGLRPFRNLLRIENMTSFNASVDFRYTTIPFLYYTQNRETKRVVIEMQDAKFLTL